MNQETLIANNTFLDKEMNNIDAKSNNESCTRDRTSIIFSDDIQFSQNKEMFRVQINNESIK